MSKEQEQLQSIALGWWKRINGGQSILEVIIALAIFSLIGAAMVSMAVGGFVTLDQGGEQTEAEALAQEGIEAVRSIRDNAWNRMIYDISSVSIDGASWVFDGEGSTETIGQYTRNIYFDDVCRDSLDDITDCPGEYNDIQTQKVTSEVVWVTRGNIENNVKRVTYLTNWDSVNWTQTNWSGGDGQIVWSDESRYNIDDENIETNTAGQISLISGKILDGGFGLPVGTTHDWPFTDSNNYTFDISDIQVTGGVAELKAQGGATVSGTTTNPSFDANTTGWVYSDWGQDGGEVDVTGTRVGSGGSPSGWVDVNFPAGKNDELGGYWEQSFTTTVVNPVADLDFDWQVTQYDAAPNTFQMYVFIDSLPGEPTIGTEVWSSGEITSTSGWVSVSNLDISSFVAAAGTYYLKVAVWLETPGGRFNTGPFEIGYDNVYLYWEKTTGGGYAVDLPAIYPVNSFSAPGVQSWNSFTETANKNGGEIYYQLSDDDGVIWYYWDGASWSMAGASDYNTASIIDANITNFSAASGQIKFKAFLESDGTQLVQLDNVNISFSVPGSVWSFATWDVGPGEEIPTGGLQTTGGNPDSYVDITIYEDTSDEVGGVWTQEFTTYGNNPSSATIDFDYKVFDYNGIPELAEIRVYVDTVAGDPINQISSIGVTGEGFWTAFPQADISGAVVNAGTYYLKLVFYVETPEAAPTGPYVVGFDNVYLGLGDAAYPTSGYLVSSSFDMTKDSAVQVAEWDYKLPVNADLTLKIMTADSSVGPWTEGVVHGSDITASTTRKILSTDLNGHRWVRYRADFTTDGTDTPILYETRVNYK